MPLIDVKRDDQAIAAETVDKPEVTSLTAFREKLGGRMRSSDEFLSKGGSPIETIIQENDVTVADIVENGVVKIRAKPQPAGPLNVRVVKGGSSNPVQAKIEDFLSEFRKQLSSMSSSLITEDERFQEKDVAGSSFTPASEKAFKVRDAMDKDQQIKIVHASPKRNITIEKGKSSQSFPEVEKSQSLLQFKKYLVANGGMTATDIFLVGAAEVKDEQAGKITVAQAADKDNKISVKIGEPILGKDPVTVNPTDPSTNLRDWSQTINYGTPEYPVPTKFSGKAPTKEDPEDKWSALKDNEKQYVFSVRQLGSAIVFPRAAVDGEKLSAELTKADAKAVSISVAQPGVRSKT